MTSDTCRSDDVAIARVTDTVNGGYSRGFKSYCDARRYQSGTHLLATRLEPSRGVFAVQVRLVEPTKIKWTTRLRAIRYGEGTLWVLFLFFALTAMDSGGSDVKATLAGISALAAIGVRATRVEGANSARS